MLFHCTCGRGQLAPDRTNSLAKGVKPALGQAPPFSVPQQPPDVHQQQTFRPRMADVVGARLVNVRFLASSLFNLQHSTFRLRCSVQLVRAITISRVLFQVP